jgi:3-hydroxyisobutyrate dehydrogenase-like beta-hydroxyacid dehydrogenase
MSLSPRVIALLGFGEAGSAIARGLAAENGWRGPSKPGDNAPRRLIAIDPALDKDARGTALGKEARRLEVAISDRYTEALSEADLVICAVQGEHALDAATSAAAFMKKGAHFLDLCTVTGKMADEDRDAIEKVGGRYVDIAVMGGFFKYGIKAPMLVAGGDAKAAVDWMNANGFDAKYLGPKPGSASSVKMVRSVLMKGLEALGVEALVTAERQGIREEVLECLADVDLVPFREHLSSLVQTHIVHARRRWEEMGLVAQTLRETGVEPKMTVTTEQTLRRSVEAGIAPADGKVPKLDEALKLLSEKVVRGR